MRIERVVEGTEPPSKESIPFTLTVQDISPLDLWFFRATVKDSLFLREKSATPDLLLRVQVGPKNSVLVAFPPPSMETVQLSLSMGWGPPPLSLSRVPSESARWSSKSGGSEGIGKTL